MEARRIAESLTGRFSFYAMYPFDTQVIIRLPDRDSEKLLDLRDCLNEKTKLSLPSYGALKFTPVRLREIFTDSPNAKWSALKAKFPPQWLNDLLESSKNGQGKRIRQEVAIEAAEASLLLYDGGIIILVVEAFFKPSSEDARVPTNFPAILAQMMNSTVRYENKLFIDSCRNLLKSVSKQLRASARRGDLSEYRLRKTSVPEPYPTILAQIECRGNTSPKSLNLAGSDLASEMYLDKSELVNVLPSFEDDYVAVGYDSAWWLYEAPPTTEENRPKEKEEFIERKARLESTFAYCLALSMQVYVLNAEVDEELRKLRGGFVDDTGSEGLDDPILRIRRLRSEIDDIWRQLPLESFSTWVTDIFLFRGILHAWLVEESTEALRAALETIHKELLELEQRRFTRLGIIFASASVASVFLAALTFGFTQIHWEQGSAMQQFSGAAVKLSLGLIIILLLAPISYLLFPPWRKNWIPKLFRKKRRLPTS